VFASISATVASWAQNVAGWLNTVVGWMHSFYSRVTGAITGLGDAIARPFLDAYGKIEGFIGRVVSLFSGFGSRILANISSMGGQILEKLLGGLPGPVRSALGFARGGIVLGPVTATVGESGAEAIVPLNRPLSQVDPSVRVLSAIAQGKMPGFSAGGVVTNAGRTVTVAPGAIVVQTQVENPRRVAEAVLDRMILALV
jgi:acyl-coenzyme A thioesterase PaaI-like protein